MLHLKMVLVLFLAVPSLTVHGQIEMADWSAKMEKIVLAESNGEFERALELCDALLTESEGPMSGVTILLRADIKKSIGDLLGGIQDCDKALELFPTNYSANTLRADIHFINGDYEKAIADYTQSIDGQREAYDKSAKEIDKVEFGDPEMKAKWDLLVKDVREALASDYLSRAKCYIKLERKEIACSDLEAAKELGFSEAGALFKEACGN